MNIDSHTSRGFFNNVLYEITKTIYPNGVIELLIERVDGEAIHNWQDFQKIKNEYLGKDSVAIEVYPKQSEVVDYANKYHLFYIPKFKAPNTHTGEHTVMEYNRELSTNKLKYWSQGITLMTAATKKWSKEMIDVNNKVECKMVFESFAAEDMGTGRKLICVCNTEAQAHKVCEDHNELINRVMLYKNIEP